jgi:putative restriction endonuclease
MAKAVIIQSSHSIYEDQPGIAYHFPKQQYLSVVDETVGDWIIFMKAAMGGTADTTLCSA